MTAAPTISVIIPTFNRRELVVAAVNSVLAGSQRPDELIVVDDGSTDGTADALRTAYGDALTLVTQANAGPSAARNRGAGVACGDYLLFLDSDDLFFPWSIATVRHALARDPDADVLYLAQLLRPLSAAAAAVPQESFQLRSGMRPPDVMASGVFAGSSCLCVRRALFEASHGFWEARCGWEDFDWLYRLPADTRAATLLAPATVVRHHHPGGMTFDLRSALAGAKRVVEQELSEASPYPAAAGSARRTHIGGALTYYATLAFERGEADVAGQFGTMLGRLGLEHPRLASSTSMGRKLSRCRAAVRSVAAMAVRAAVVTLGARKPLIAATVRWPRLAFLLHALPVRLVVTPYGCVHLVDETSHALSELARHGIADPATCAMLWRALRPGDRVLDLAAEDRVATLLAAKRVGREGSVLSWCGDAAARVALEQEAALSGCVLTFADGRHPHAGELAHARLLRVDGRSLAWVAANATALAAGCDVLISTARCGSGDFAALGRELATLERAGFRTFKLPRRHASSLAGHGVLVPAPVPFDGDEGACVDGDLLVTRRDAAVLIAALPPLARGELFATLRAA